MNNKLIYLLQRGLPLHKEPFAEISNQLGMTQSAVIEEIQNLKQNGLIRRFGGVFNSNSLKYRTCLCAVNVPENDIEKVTSLICPDPGITHCYQREGIPNIWFTITVYDSQYDKTMEQLRNSMKPYELLDFPSVKPYKIQVIFDRNGSEKKDPVPILKLQKLELSSREKKVVNYLQGDISVSTDLFKDVAENVGYTTDELLKLLNCWQKTGALKRISAIIKHQQFGFKGNAMCVWKVPKENIDETGKKLAGKPFVTHCYQREEREEFSFNLYAMIHAEDREKTIQKFNELEKIEYLKNGIILFSVKEFKKTSPVYYEDNSK